MFRAYILDDERLAVERLTRLLHATDRVKVVGSASDPEAALAELRERPVDVLFLDIQMPGLTGFEVLAKLERDIPVIFTTAYDRYAIDAFTVNSIDYLLKPIEPERLDRALDRLSRMVGQPPPDVRALARELAAQLGPGPSASLGAGPSTPLGTGPSTPLGTGPSTPLGTGRRLERIASRVGERTTVLEVARITHFFSKDKLTFAVSGGREHAVDYTLNELDERLDPRRFIRIHRATIANLAFVAELYPGVDGVIVRLKDEHKTELSVARDRVRALKDRLGI